MTDPTLTTAHRLLGEAVDALAAAGGSGASPDELLSVLRLCAGVGRRLDRVAVDALAGLARRGTFAERGYRRPDLALSDLVGWETFEARLRVTAAEQVCPRVGLDGTVLAPRLPATAAVFTAGGCGVRHVESVAKVLGSSAAGRLTAEQGEQVEAQLAAHADRYTPAQLLAWGIGLVEALDQDGPEPDDGPPPAVNDLRLTPHGDRPGGRLAGRFDDAALYDAIAAAVDAGARPVDSDDTRPAGQRQAEALADVCGYALDHSHLPQTGGTRPHINVIVWLEDLENRARAAMLDFGGTLTPASPRMMCCDAAVVPIVLDGAGQPLDVGRATRTIPDGLRRAVAARDGGCARCGRPPSWCEVHHIREWELGGETKLANLVMLCKVCHRQVHHAGWDVQLTGGLPEFYPPAWIDPQRRPRRRPPRPHRTAATGPPPRSGADTRPPGHPPGPGRRKTITHAAIADTGRTTN